MHKKIIFIAFLAFILLIPSLVSASTLPGEYKPGDEIRFKYPESGPTFSLPGSIFGIIGGITSEPKFVRWSLIDPTGNVVYEEDHDLTFKKRVIPIIGPWIWYDEYSIHVPAFAMAGTWKMKGTLFNNLLFIIQCPELFPYEKQFTVKETGIVENLLAPWYYSFDMGFFGGRFSGSLPIHPFLILGIIVAIIAVILIIRSMMKRATPSNGR